MFLISIFKRENRRLGQDRSTPINMDPNDRRMTKADRKPNGDRRKDIGRRTGMYYKLSDQQQDKLDRIINILERSDDDY
jgi:hypothetical protein